jgi:hypothetical protein
MKKKTEFNKKGGPLEIEISHWGFSVVQDGEELELFERHGDAESYVLRKARARADVLVEVRGGSACVTKAKRGVNVVVLDHDTLKECMNLKKEA